MIHTHTILLSPLLLALRVVFKNISKKKYKYLYIYKHTYSAAFKKVAVRKSIVQKKEFVRSDQEKKNIIY